MNALEFDKLLWTSRRESKIQQDFIVFSTPHTDIRYADTQAFNKPSLVFFCDPPVQIESYHRLRKLLASEYRILVIELPGFGHSKIRSGKALEFANTAAQLAALLNSLKLDRFIFIAPCVTSFVAVNLVKQHGLKPQGLILLQAPNLDQMKAWTNRMDPKGILRTPYLGQLLIRLKSKKLADFWIRYSSGHKLFVPQLVEEVRQGLENGGSYSLASMLQSWYKKGPQDGHLDLACLSIWGRKDRSHPNTPCECTAAHSRNMDHLEIAHTGHFSELEDPEQFVRLASPFLNKYLPTQT